jgi:hypothetical protein
MKLSDHDCRSSGGCGSETLLLLRTDRGLSLGLPVKARDMESTSPEAISETDAAADRVPRGERGSLETRERCSSAVGAAAGSIRGMRSLSWLRATRRSSIGVSAFHEIRFRGAA